MCFYFYTSILLSLCHFASPLKATTYLSNVQECHQPFTSDFLLNGTISSHGYPQMYQPKTHCRYDFIGRNSERVQIIFTDFNLYHPERNSSDCGGADMLSAFVYSIDGVLSRLDDFCGSTTPLSIMSNGPKLTLEFNAPMSSRYIRGFNAIYSFVKDFGIKTGKQLNDQCYFKFNSSETSNGTFTSPNYPGYYPRETECHYLFYGNGNENVEIYFTYFHIDGVQPCEGDTHSDYVEFSNYMPIDRKFDRQCGSLRERKIKSDRKFFRVTFKSNDRYDATGFHATYQFSDKSNHLTIRNVRSTSQAIRLSFCCIFISTLIGRF